MVASVGYGRKVLLETGYRIFKILIPFYIAGTKNLRLLSVSGLSGTGFFIPDSVFGRNRIKELTGIPARILMDLFALKLKKIRALIVDPIGSSNYNGFLGTVKSIAKKVNPFFAILTCCNVKENMSKKANKMRVSSR